MSAMSADEARRKSGSSPAARSCTVRRRWTRSPSTPARSRRTSTPTLPVRVVWKPTLKGPEAIMQMCLEANAAPACVGVITWMHTFSPAKMWVDGLTQLGKPLAHLHTQFNRELPWSEIDMEFMNLNQSAHGDREFGFIVARLRLDRKIVVGHWQDSEVIAELDAWSRVACAVAESRKLKIVRFGGMNMREVAVTGGDRAGGADPARLVDERLRRRRSGRADRRGARRRGRPARRGVRGEVHARPGAAPGRRPAREPALRRPAGDRDPRVSHRRRLRRLHDDVRGSARAEPAPRARLPASDGRRLRLRRRGRLEGGRRSSAS